VFDEHGSRRMRSAYGRGLRLFVAGLTLLLIGCDARRSDRAPDGLSFFKGRTITYIVSSHPGGGYDTYARLLVRHLQRHIPGSRIVVRNIPGAGALLGLMAIHNAAPDGLTIGTFTVGFIYPQIVGELEGRVDLGRMSWVGKAASEPRVLALGRHTGITTPDALRLAPVRLATTPPGTSAFYAAQILAEAVGFQLDLVPGFDEDEAQLAMLRGDVHGLIASPSSLRPVVAQGLATMVLRVGESPDFEHVPSAAALVRSPRGRLLLSLLETHAVIGRVTAGPPDIPADRLRALRDAFLDTMRDPALLEDAARLKLPIDPLDGDAVAVRVRQSLDAPPEAVAWLKNVATRVDP
jgi:tripartite-type tricarboxylate transporter receptor subunit TctC